MTDAVNRQLCVSAKRDDVAEVERLLAGGADPNVFVGTNTPTPLHEAAARGHMATVNVLLRAHADVDGANCSGWTPLNIAAFNKRADVVVTLIAAGADVHAGNLRGETPLHGAALYGMVDVARALLHAGASPSARNMYGERPVEMVSGAVGVERGLVAAPHWCS